MNIFLNNKTIDETDFGKGFLNTLERALAGVSPVEYMFPIRDIKVYPDEKTGKDKVVVVSFFDGTQEKAICDEQDTFSLEQGITICLMKYILSALTSGDGTKEYNKAIRSAVKLYNKNRKAEAAANAEKMERIERETRRANKRKERAERKRNAENERQIANYMEAIRRINAEEAENAALAKEEKRAKAEKKSKNKRSDTA